MSNNKAPKKTTQGDWSMAASAQPDATKGRRVPQFGEGSSQMTSAPGSAPVPAQARQQQFC